MSEKYCLRWEAFETNVSKSFGLLRHEDYLHDVTLVCDDNKQVSAHKLVLSACSEFFKSIFKNSKHPNPLICLEGISSQELQDILDYMYNGETNIFQVGLDKFLSIAQRFKIMGLLQNKELNSDQLEENGNKDSNNQEYAFEFPDSVMEENFKIEAKHITSKVNRNANRAISINSDNLSYITQKADEIIETLSDGSLKCLKCGKLTSKGSANYRQNMRHHAETHLDTSFDCELCGKAFRLSDSFRKHVYRQHR